MSASAIEQQIGYMFIASQLEEAVIDSLHMWFPTYLAEAARNLGISPNSLPQPQNYTNRNSFDAEIGEKIPKVVVLSPGLFTTPQVSGDGTYRATWRLGVGVATAAKDETQANMLMKAYSGAARDIVLQKNIGDSSLSVTRVTWLNESYDDLPIPNQLQLYKAASLEFAFDINNVASRYGGPDTPTVEPIPAYKTVEKVIIDVELAPTEEEL
jgi:hypothetical protein